MKHIDRRFKVLEPKYAIFVYILLHVYICNVDTNMKELLLHEGNSNFVEPPRTDAVLLLLFTCTSYKLVLN